MIRLKIILLFLLLLINLNSFGLSVSGANFGTYSPMSAIANDTVGAIALPCPSTKLLKKKIIPLNNSVTITVSAGNSGDYQHRYLRSGQYKLFYNLYVDPSRTLVWGDGTEDTQKIVMADCDGEVNIYGRMPPRQNIGAGQYSDNLIVTFTY